MNKEGIPGTDNLTDSGKKQELQKLMRRVFSTAEGRIAFNVLLTDLHYFQPARDETTQALSNYAKYLVTERMGIVDTIAVSDAMLGTDMEEGTDGRTE